MKKLVRLTALLLAMLVAIYSFSFIALAEEETGGSGGETTPGETTPGETTPGETPPEVTPPENPDAYTVNISFAKDGAAGSSVFFNELSVDGASFTGTAGTTLEIRIEPKSGYNLTGATFSGLALTPDENGRITYSFTEATAGSVYELSVEAEAVPVTSKVEIWAKDSTLSSVPYDAFVNGVIAENVQNDTLTCLTGDQVTITFNIDGFDVANAYMSINGASVALEGNSYSFTVSGDTKVEFGYGIVPVRFEFINGPGTVEMKDAETGTPKGSVTENKTVHFKKGVGYILAVYPGAGRLFENEIAFEGCEFTGENGTYTVIANGATKITVTLKTDTSLPVGVNVSVSAGANGSVSVGGVTVSGGTQSVNGISVGDNLVIKANPNSGYVVDQFLVNGQPVVFQDNTYIITNISADAAVTVTFKQGGEALKPVGVADINWNTERVLIDIRGSKAVESEVYRHISQSNTDGRVVEFVSELGTVCIPMGTQFVGDLDKADLRIKLVTDVTLLNGIKQAVADTTDANIKYNAYALDFGIELPKGTKLIFNLGAEYAGTTVDVLEFRQGASDKPFTGKGSLAVNGKGVTAQQDYSNESVLIVAKQVEDVTFTIESSVINNVGGTINPLGKQPVKLDAACTYSISANGGYVIKQILVDGIPVSGVEGLKNYTHEFKNVGTNHTIAVEFELDTENGADNNAHTPSTATTVVVVLLIVLVALAGAAALFIVKWRQEKF